MPWDRVAQAGRLLLAVIADGSAGEFQLMSMFRSSPGRGGQSFVEYALLLILVSIVLLSILLILGNDLRTFINDLLQRWFPATEESSVELPLRLVWLLSPAGR